MISHRNYLCERQCILLYNQVFHIQHISKYCIVLQICHQQLTTCNYYCQCFKWQVESTIISWELSAKFNFLLAYDGALVKSSCQTYPILTTTSKYLLITMHRYQQHRLCGYTESQPLTFTLNGRHCVRSYSLVLKSFFESYLQLPIKYLSSI